MTPVERLFSVDHRTVSGVSGPLVFVERAEDVGYDDMVEVVGPDGASRVGRVLELEGSRAVVQVLEGTRGLDQESTTVRSRGQQATIAVGDEMIGRVFDGSGRPIDGDPPPMPEATRNVNGAPLNPVARANPSEFIETGVSAIDALITTVRGQKLPIFSGFGLPAMQLAVQIATQARVAGDDSEEVVIVFGAMGVTRREASFFRRRFEEEGALERTVVFQNLAEDSSIERLLTPRAALTCAEYLAFERDRHVLVILTDMTNYCEALREVSAAREEIPGRRGYPGYMYTDLASLYERAGRVRGKEGSVTQLLILSMPDDDITHPIPDLTGYITEGQIVLSRDLDRRGISPPIEVLPSLSRLMNAGIGQGRTREDHPDVADQLYATLARGHELRRLVSIVGEGALSEADRRHLTFAEEFERHFVGQGDTRRSIDETLDLAWELLSPFPADELKRIDAKLLEQHRGQ
jgi:V/A-type H+-transporting ATPase subunit B